MKSNFKARLDKRKFACTGDDLDEFVDVLLEANKAGISVSHNVSNVPNWSFGQSFFFATSVLTTVGLYSVDNVVYTVMSNL